MQDARSFAVAACAELGPIAGVSEADKAKAASAVFTELHKWAETSLAVGAGEEATEKRLRVGLKAVRKKFKDDPKVGQAYGFIDPFTILSVISALLSIGTWLWKWWTGRLGT